MDKQTGIVSSRSALWRKRIHRTDSIVCIHHRFRVPSLNHNYFSGNRFQIFVALAISTTSVPGDNELSLVKSFISPPSNYTLNHSLDQYSVQQLHAHRTCCGGGIWTPSSGRAASVSARTTTCPMRCGGGRLVLYAGRAAGRSKWDIGSAHRKPPAARTAPTTAAICATSGWRGGGSSCNGRSLVYTHTSCAAFKNLARVAFKFTQHLGIN